MLRRLVAMFETEDIHLGSVRLGARPVPADGLPIVGPVSGVDGAYVAVMHSGIALTPTVARLVTAEIVHGIEAGQLTGLRTARFRADPEIRPIC